jgi:hypothetical protein
MALSIDGIPPVLLPTDARLRFLHWVADLPIPHNAKRKLMATWRVYNAATFTIDDYRTAGLAPPTVSVHKETRK